MGNRRGNEWSLRIAPHYFITWQLTADHPCSHRLVIGTLLIGFGISGGNVLLPAIIKGSVPAVDWRQNQPLHRYHGASCIAGNRAGRTVEPTISDMKFTMAAFSLVGVAGLVVWALFAFVGWHR